MKNLPLNTTGDLSKTLMKLIKVTREEIIEWYEKPDLVDNVGPFAIVKKLLNNEKAILMTLNTQGQEVKLLSIYLLHSSFLKTNINEIAPLQMLSEFMNMFGKLIDTPHGRVKCLIDFNRKIFFEGVLDIPLYTNALKTIT